jgi:hypothetical protein
VPRCWRLVANAVGLTDKAFTRVLNVDLHWYELAIQVGFAVIGTAIAAAITHTRVAERSAQDEAERACKS